LSEEELEKAKAERSAFFEATSDLRQQAYQKDLELRAELAKQRPDAEKAARIQKEISGLRAEMDQQHLEHRLRMKAINPELGMGYGQRSCSRSGGSKGAGGYGKGNCWQ
jgi:Spy/CpxP family protein refolding chaperone